METIVFDETARQGSVRVSTLTVPPAAAGSLGMSSLVLVSRAEEVRDPMPAGTGGALYVGRTLLYPNLGEPIKKSASSELTFYFALYGRQQGVTASAELLRNGSVLAMAPVDLTSDTGERGKHVGRLPIGQLPAGTYELRIRVTGGGHELSRTAYFTLVD